jgi:hypothetical protein
VDVSAYGHHYQTAAVLKGVEVLSLEQLVEALVA